MNDLLQRRRGMTDLYEELEYLDLSGHQWLDTGHIPTQNEDFSITIHKVFYYEEYVYQHLFRAFGTNGSFVLCQLSSSVRWGFECYFKYFQTQNLTKIFSLTFGAILKIDIKAGGYFYVNDVLQGQQAGVADTDVPLYISVPYDYYPGLWGRLYTYSISQVQNCVPRLRKSDNKPGMLNLIDGTFFTNQGTGEFGYKKLDGTIVAPI